MGARKVDTRRVVLGRYAVQGAFHDPAWSSVWRAVDLESKRPVLLKLWSRRPGRDERLLRLTADLLLLRSRLGHPAILAVSEPAEDDHHLALVLAPPPGTPPGATSPGWRGRVSGRDLKSVARDLLRAVAELYAAGEAADLGPDTVWIAPPRALRVVPETLAEALRTDGTRTLGAEGPGGFYLPPEDAVERPRLAAGEIRERVAEILTTIAELAGNRSELEDVIVELRVGEGHGEDAGLLQLAERLEPSWRERHRSGLAVAAGGVAVIALLALTHGLWLPPVQGVVRRVVLDDAAVRSARELRDDVVARSQAWDARWAELGRDVPVERKQVDDLLVIGSALLEDMEPGPAYTHFRSAASLCTKLEDGVRTLLDARKRLPRIAADGHALRRQWEALGTDVPSGTRGTAREAEEAADAATAHEANGAFDEAVAAWGRALVLFRSALEEARGVLEAREIANEAQRRALEEQRRWQGRRGAIPSEKAREADALWERAESALGGGAFEEATRLFERAGSAYRKALQGR